MDEKSDVLRVVVSVVVYDTQSEELHRWARSLFDAALVCGEAVSAEMSFHILLLNNGGRDLSAFYESCLEASRHIGLNCRVELVEGHGNVGYGAAQNIGIEASQGRYQVMMNPDVVLERDALLSAIEFMEGRDDVVAVSPACVGGDGLKRYLCKRYPSVLDLALRGFAPAVVRGLFSHRLNSYEMSDLDQEHVEVDVPIVSGCCLFCRRSALDEVGGFDPRYFLYFEDFDLSLRLLTRGKLAYVPSVKIEHSGGNAAGKGVRHIAMFTRSAVRFFNTYGWKWF